MLLAGCGDGLDVVDTFFVQFVPRFDNFVGMDGPAMLGWSANSHRLCRHWKEVLRIFVTYV